MLSPVGKGTQDHTSGFYGGTAAFNAGVGEKARSDARIILEGIKATSTEVRTREASYVIWQKQFNEGSQSQRLILPSFSGPSKPSFSASGRAERADSRGGLQET